MTPREYREIFSNSALSPMQKNLYAYLRGCACWKTFIVGDADKKMISYQSIREHLEYRPPARSHERPITLSNDQIKRLLASLVKGGYLTRLKGQRYGRELRYFLPFASTGEFCPQDERQMSATDERQRESQAQQALPGYERHTSESDERHTSTVNTLSQKNTHIYAAYEPDDDDWQWLRYMFGRDFAGPLFDVKLETEKFNLRRAQDPEANPDYAREAWREWMIKGYEYAAARRARTQG